MNEIASLVIAGTLFAFGAYWYYVTAKSKKRGDDGDRRRALLRDRRAARFATASPTQTKVTGEAVTKELLARGSMTENVPSLVETPTRPTLKRRLKQNDTKKITSQFPEKTSGPQPDKRSSISSPSSPSKMKKVNASSQVIKKDQKVISTEKTDPSIPPSPTKKNAKRRLRQKSPSQSLCQSLSFVTSCQVLIAYEKDATSKTSSKSKAISTDRTITLNLKNCDKNDEQNNEWDVVIQAFQELLSTDLASSFRKELKDERRNFSVRRAAIWHSKCEQIIANGVPAVPIEGKLCQALELFMSFVARETVEAIRPHVALQAHVEDDEGISDGLFSEDYNHQSDSHSYDTAIEESHDPFNRLLLLFEELNTVITKSFLNRVFEMHRQTGENQAGPEGNLPAIVLQSLLARLARYCFYSNAAFKSTPLSSDLHGKITALGLAINLSSEVCQSLASNMLQQGKSSHAASGREMEEATWIRPVLCMAAYVIPEAGLDGPRHHGAGNNGLFLQQLQGVPEFPVGIYKKKNYKVVHQAMQEGRTLMIATKTLAQSMLRKVLASKKQAVFDWLLQTIKLNETLTDMLRGDLISPDGVASIASSRSFLLGLASTMSSLASQGLVARFESVANDAFDARFLLNKKGLGIPDEERRLFSNGIEQASTKAIDSVKNADMNFSGSTNLFFLLSALLRVSLFPALRVENELNHRDHKLFDQLQALAKFSEPIPVGLSKLAEPCVAASIGFNTFLSEPEFVRNVSNFSLLQLQWVISLAKRGTKAQKSMELAMIPEWMCKLPSMWLSQVARSSPNVLKPHQAERAVQYATELLQIGTGNAQSHFQFSPVVVAELIRIASAFVGAGVRRAVKRDQRRRRPRFGDAPEVDSDDENDLRKMQVYLSFDQNDLGVTVFTNHLVCTELCPTLLQAFSSLDVVEGLDVDKEYQFDKFQVKAEVADLFLRLWCHPNGVCKTNIINQLERGQIVDLVGKFSSSVAASLGYVLDDACHRLSDVASLYKKHRMSRDEQRFFQAQANGCSQFFLVARRLLMLLCQLSQESTFSVALCGASKTNSKKTNPVHLATMILHFVGKLTSHDGGTHDDIDFRKEGVSTSKLASEQNQMTKADNKVKKLDLLEARAFSKVEFGLDVANLCHQLLALAARWHLDTSNSSPFLQALASHDDCDVNHLRNIFHRLVSVPQGNADEDLFRRDGYIDDSILLQSSNRVKSSPESRGRRRRAKQDQLTRAEIEILASNDDIIALLNAIERYQETKSKRSTAIRGADNIQRVQRAILTAPGSSDDDKYGSILADWTVSSDSFLLDQSASSFAHYYNSAVRGGISKDSGKVLIKEAKRIYRMLPTPHPQSAAFVCFAEERMDLSRAVITGPVDTPYAHGIFSMDVFYPSGYPHVPPMVTWMTTGGGQTRFNPNLYQDGKVCLSLLGTWHASDESERWNPQVSSLAQVLLSIQTQLLVAEPYFNEPGYEISRGTQAGIAGSKKYNMNLKLATLRYAIIWQLRDPPKGFEDVVLRHFSQCRKRIVIQAKKWMLEARGTPAHPRFERAFEELLGLLSDKRLQTYNALPPLKDDLEACARLDNEIAQLNGHDHDKKQSARPPPPPRARASPQPSPQEILFAVSNETSGVNAAAVAFNPWALNQPQVEAAHCNNNASQVDDSDDELYD